MRFEDSCTRHHKWWSHISLKHANMVAHHQLAKFSLRDRGLGFWLDVGPPWLMDYAQGVIVLLCDFLVCLIA